jgi:hypothetical protein
VKGRACDRRFEGVRTRRSRRVSRKKSCGLLALAASAAVAPLASRAATDAWSNLHSGNWSTAGNWTTGLPANGADVSITISGQLGVPITVTYDYTGTNTFKSLTLDTLDQLSQSANTLTVTGTEYIGDQSIGGIFNQTGGTNSAGSVILANSAGSTGSYTLSNSASLKVTGSEYIGNQGNGVFTQTSGAHKIGGFLSIGTLAGASGTVDLSGGSLTVPTIVIGGNGTVSGGAGLLNVTGGTLTATNISILNNFSSFLLSDGTVSAGTTTVNNGTFNQTGGTNSAASLYLASQIGSSGTYNLGGSGSLTVTGYEYIGVQGNGVFNQTGGTNSAGSLELASSPGLSGTYNLSNGASLNVSAFETIGVNATGVFNQTGGSHVIGGSLSLDSGLLNVSGGTLRATNISIYGLSSFSLGGGTVTTGALTAPDWSRLIFTGGTLNLTGAGGGVSTNAGTLVIGKGAGPAILNQSGGLVTASSETVGDVTAAGNGVVNQTGGTHSAGNLFLAYVAGSSGTYNLSNSASLTVSGSEYIGNQGNGVFTQTSGTHKIGGLLSLGSFAGASGTVNLSGGSLTVPNVAVGGNGRSPAAPDCSTSPAARFRPPTFRSSTASAPSHWAAAAAAPSPPPPPRSITAPSTRPAAPTRRPLFTWHPPAVRAAPTT